MTSENPTLKTNKPLLKPRRASRRTIRPKTITTANNAGKGKPFAILKAGKLLEEVTSCSVLSKSVGSKHVKAEHLFIIQNRKTRYQYICVKIKTIKGEYQYVRLSSTLHNKLLKDQNGINGKNKVWVRLIKYAASMKPENRNKQGFAIVSDDTFYQSLPAIVGKESVAKAKPTQSVIKKLKKQTRQKMKTIHGSSLTKKPLGKKQLVLTSTGDFAAKKKQLPPLKKRTGVFIGNTNIKKIFTIHPNVIDPTTLSTEGLIKRLGAIEIKQFSNFTINK